MQVCLYVRTLQLLIVNNFDADGQKITNKLSVQVSNETKKVKHMLNQYNSCARAVALPTECLQEVLLLEGAFWGAKNSHTLKNETIQHYLKKQRSTEEIVMIESEMQNVIDYLSKKAQSIVSTLTEADYEPSQFKTGAMSLLRKQLLQTQLQMKYTIAEFSTMDIPLLIQEDDLDITVSMPTPDSSVYMTELDAESDPSDNEVSSDTEDDIV